MTTTAPNPISLQIVNGPSVDLIIDAFKYTFTPQKLFVNFKVMRAYNNSRPHQVRIKAQITELRYDADGGLFIGGNGEELVPGTSVTLHGSFTGYYNPKIRQGGLSFFYRTMG